MGKIFACKECGQVYRGTTPEKCMRMKASLLGKITECNSVNFERIKEEDVLDIHDVPQFLWDMFLEKTWFLWINL